MEKGEWFGLVYNDFDFSDKFEYKRNGSIRNKETGKTMKQTGNSTAINYLGEVRRINIPILLTGKRAERKPRKKTGKKSGFTDHQLQELRKMIREEMVLTFGGKYSS